MSVYAIAVFLHIVGALGLFAALALEWASLYNLRRVATAAQAREWAKLLSALRFVGGPSALTILVTGLYMMATRDRKSTRLNSSHLVISYAVFCLKKKKKNR